MGLSESEQDRENQEGGQAGDRKHGSSRLWTPYSEPANRPEPGRPVSEPPGQPEEEVSEEEMRRRIEEALEKLTVTDVVLDMVVSLISLAYQRLGLPQEVNEKYRDLKQARLAIDSVDALARALEGHVEQEQMKPITGALDNLKINYARNA